MGTEYVLVKIDTNEYYELGKGMWNFPYKVFILHNVFDTPSDLYNHLVNYVFDTYMEYDCYVYLNELANGIYTWSGDERLRFYREPDMLEDPCYKDVRKTG